MNKPLIQTENLDQKAYQIIKDMIENRELLPGQKISQEKLATELGISRTPLISALKFLEHEKLVETKPRRGFFVRLFTIEEMISIFEIREVLEGLSARRTAKSITNGQIKQLRKIFQPFLDSGDVIDEKSYSQADRRFHNYIAEISQREFLSSILTTFNVVSLAYLYPTKDGLIRPPNETIKEHIKIVEAICNHDPDEAERAMRAHLQATVRKLIADIASDNTHDREVNQQEQ